MEDEEDPATVAGLASRERSRITILLAEGELDSAAALATELIETIGNAWRRGDSAGLLPDDMLPLLAEVAAASIDLVQCQMALGNRSGATSRLGEAAETLGLLQSRLELVGYVSCFHGYPSATGRCARRPPCPPE